MSTLRAITRWLLGAAGFLLGMAAALVFMLLFCGGVMGDPEPGTVPNRGPLLLWVLGAVLSFAGGCASLLWLVGKR